VDQALRCVAVLLARLASIRGHLSVQNFPFAESVMARARLIKPGFFANEDLAECSPWARLCFAGLWTLSDRAGRMEDRPKRIKGQLFPMDSIDVEPLLDELVQHHFIVRYASKGQGFIQVLEFSKHQTPHHREPMSAIPSPQSLGLLSDNNGVKAQGKPEALNGSDDHKAQGKPEALPPSSVIPSTPSHAVTGNRYTVTSRTTLARQAERMFDEQFWPAYPRKVGKQDAAKAFIKLDPDAGLLDVMLKAVARQQLTPEWKRDAGQFIPHPASWINGKRWQDEIPMAVVSSDVRSPLRDAL
jgi:hypothetical protein